MYIYFDKNGTIKEVVNDKSIRKGSNEANKLYVYLEDDTLIDDIWYLQKNPDGSLTNEVSFIDNVVTKAIPYDAKRDMTYFKDFVQYKFYVFTLTTNYLKESGLVSGTIRVVVDNELWALGELKFNVQTNVINVDNDITQSQYDYLLLAYASRTLNEQTGSDLDHLLDEKIEAKISSLGTPDVFDTTENIEALTSNEGIAVATDTGYIWIWDSEDEEYVNTNYKYLADVSVYYTKTEANALLDAKADKATTYTKTEDDALLAAKADKSTAITHTGNQLQDYSGNNIYPNIDTSTYYNKTQVDDLVKTQAFYRNKTVFEGLGYYTSIPYNFEENCVYWLLYQGDSATATFRTYDSNSQYHNEIILSNNVMVKFISDDNYLGVRWAIGNLTIIKESEIEQNSIEYKYFTEKFNNLVNYLGDIQFIEESQYDITVGEYWNKEFNLTIPKGSVLETSLLEYTGQYFSSFTLQLKDTSNNWNVIATTSNIGERLRYVASKNYTAVRLQVYRTTVEHNVTEKILWASNVKNGFIKDALNPKTYYLKKDGTGDFTSIVTAINTVCNEKNATLYIGDGTWDIVDELGSAYMESVTQSQRGLYLKNGVHIICSSKSLIVAKYTGTNANTREWFSAFNSGEGGFTLENATIESDNIRYTIHDERDEDADIYYNHYINCKMKHTNGFYVQCIGGGLGLDGHIIIDGCIFETDKTSSVALVSYHNSMDGGWTDATSQNAKSFVDIKNNYFSNKGNIRITIMGKSQKVSNVLISNNSLGSNITVENSVNYYWYDNVEVKQWNNEVRS